MEKIFNLKNFLAKKANYEGAQGYFVGQTRAWMNCTKKGLDAGKSPNDSWMGCLEEYQKGDGCMSWVEKHASDAADELKKRGQVAGQYQLQMASYWDRIDKKVKAGMDIGNAVMETLEECKKDAQKIPLK